MPLWLPLLLIWLLPVSREIANVNFQAGFSPNVEPQIDDATGSVAWSTSHPDDVGAALRVILSGADDTSNEKHLPTFDDLEVRFPRETWLPAFREARARELTSDFSLLSRPSRTALALRQRLLKSKQREPDNAFWVVALSCWEWNFAPRRMVPLSRVRVSRGSIMGPSIPPTPATLVPDDEPTLRCIMAMLLSARHCTRYNDGIWEAESVLRHADAQRLGWSLERQRDELDHSANDPRNAGGNDSPVSIALTLLQFPYPATAIGVSVAAPGAPSPAPGTPTRVPGISTRKPPPARIPPLLAPLTMKRRMEFGVALAHIGALMSEQKEVAFRDSLAQWWLWNGWALDQVPRSTLDLNGGAFVVRARKRGFFDLVKEAQRVDSQAGHYDALNVPTSGRGFVTLCDAGNLCQFQGADALMPPLAFRSAGFCALVMLCTMCLSGVWLALNLCLIRGKGEPSPRPARWWPASVTVVTVALIGWWMEFNSLDNASLWGTGTISALLALCCAIVTVQRHRATLKEAAFDRWNTSIIPARFALWLAPAGITVSVFIVCLGFFLNWMSNWLLFAPFLSPVSIPRYGLISWNEIYHFISLYGVASLALSLIFWLASWRWGWKAARPITHSGLRWYKESIGASICVLVWLYLIVALAAWPARSTAKRMIAERWQMGDWAWLQKNL